MSSGLFNKLLAPAAISPIANFSLGSWNARSLFCKEIDKLWRKIRLVKKLLRNLDIFCLQEVRGSWPLVEKYLGPQLEQFWVHSSFLGGNKGGLLTFVRKALAPDPQNILKTELVSGRVLRTRISGPDGHQTIYNLHNHGLSLEDIALIQQSVRSDRDSISENPHNESLFLLGDLNFPSIPKEKFYYQSGTMATPGTGHIAAPSQKLAEVCSTLIEIQSRLPTHYAGDTDTGTSIDRIFTGIQPFLIPLNRWSIEHHGDPKELARTGISDHCPVFLRATITKPINRTCQRIPCEYFKDNLFEVFHERMCRDADLDAIPYPSRLATHKVIIRASALLVREHLQDVNEDAPFIRAGRLTTISRIIWSQDIALAKKILKTSELAKKFLHIAAGANGIGEKVSLKDPAIFSATVDNAKSTWFNNMLAKEESQNPHKTKKSNNFQKMSRLSQLWVPINKKVQLAGIIDEDGATLREEQAMTACLGKLWQPVFNPKDFHGELAQDFLNEHDDAPGYQGVKAPTEFDYLFKFGKTCRVSTPGPDGIPYLGWASSGIRGINTLHKTDIALREGRPPPENFNESGITFLAKGSESHDAIELIRKAKSTRPISTLNSDHKIIVAVNVSCLGEKYEENIHDAQSGFVAGRNFLNNIVDLDSMGRILSMHFLNQKYHQLSIAQQAELSPILPLYDMETAFPSVIHAWIFLVLRHRKVPKEYCTLFQACYINAHAAREYNGVRTIFLRFLSGVLQGCPGSAFLFNNSIDPFIRNISNTLRTRKAGILRACADDLGAALRALRHLEVLAPIFDSACMLAGLTLKPSKCCLIILSPPLPGLFEAIREWLQKNIPQWADIQIGNSGKYLGFHLGPVVGNKNWADPMNKLQSRIQVIKSSRVPISIATYTYNTRVIPVLEYVAQLIPLPKGSGVKESVALHSVLKMPHNTLGPGDFFHYTNIGSRNFRSFTCSCNAALLRTALVTVPAWPKWLTQLTIAASSVLSMRELFDGKLSPMFWDSPPIACNLSNAYQGFPGCDKLSVGSREFYKSISQPPVSRVVSTEASAAVVAPQREHSGGGPGVTHLPHENRAFSCKNASFLYGRCANPAVPEYPKMSGFVGRLGVAATSLPPDPSGRPFAIEPGALTGVSKIQSRIYSELVKSCFPFMLDDTIQRRIRKLFDPYVLPDFSAELANTFRKLKNLRGHDANRVLRTWTNGWCTSRRFQERPVHPCYYGCTFGEDSLEHYLLCPVLYALLRFFFSEGFRLPGFEIHEEPHMRIGLYNPSVIELKIVACTFSAYHAMKSRYRDWFYRGGCLIPSAPIPTHLHRNFLGLFAETFSAEANELSLDTRRFDPAAFNAFTYGVAAIRDG